MTIVVTGAAGFIGAHVTRALVQRGQRVLGIDNLTPYYAVSLKEARLARLCAGAGFAHQALDIADAGALEAALVADEGRHGPIRAIIHLAAQAGVRYSLENPGAYVTTNVTGQLAVLEAARRRPRIPVIYASSSSVYGANTRQPFRETDRVDHPVSLYAATKRSAELLAETYGHLFGLSLTGLRFFTVYGPWGRPDMAPWLFTAAIRQGRPVRLFNQGQMARDFTYIDDIVAGVLAALDRAPPPGAPPRLYNLGNSQPESLERFVSVLEQALERPAIRTYAPLQPGDVVATFADITAAGRDLGYAPLTPLETGLARFVAWYQAYDAGTA